MQMILSSLQALDMEISYGLRVNAGKAKLANTHALSVMQE